MTSSHTWIPASAAGAHLPSECFAVSPRALMCYAASLGASDDIYLNDLRPGRLMGLPPFTVVPEWRVVNGAPYRNLLGLDDAVMWRCIHVQQDSRFLRPFRAGMTLETRGIVECLKQTRLGVYVAVRLQTSEPPAVIPLDAAATTAGQLVAESWFCGIFLNTRLDGRDTILNPAPALPSFPANPAPASHTMLRVDSTLPHLYTAATDIWNPIHTERHAAQAAGLEDILLHGTCTWASAGLTLIRLHGGGDPSSLQRLGARMAAKVEVGAELFLQCAAAISLPNGNTTIPFQAIDQRGEIVLADGVAEFLPPRH